ncbi:MAG: hypothetical protein HN350_00015 [Phycisphaerales bacterium]|jgi:flagellar basal body-associated protein FliL|nr:hypothetical protein [Phycisphaerales bacterium]
MPEDDINDQLLTDTLEDGDAGGKTGIMDKLLAILLPLGVIVLFAGAGYFASGLTAPAQVEAQEEVEPSEPEKTPPVDSDQGYVYFDLEPIITNLNEPQATRYIKVIFSLGSLEEDKAEVEAAIAKKTHELKNHLLIYLSNLSLNDVRGAKNINRVRREVQDSINERLWPSGRPMIANVSLKDWIVQ